MALLDQNSDRTLGRSKRKEQAPSPAADPNFITRAEVSVLLRISNATVYRLVARGELRVYRICRRLLFRRADVMAYVESCACNPWAQEFKNK